VNRKPALIAALIGMAVVVLMVIVLIAPKASQVRSTNKKVDDAVAQEQVLRSELQQRQAEAKAAPQDRKRLKDLQSQIPPTSDLPGLIRLLNDTAEKSGVDFATLAPGTPAPTGSVTVIPIQITIKGTFFAVDQYLYLLETLPRISKVITLSVTPGTDLGPPPELQVALTANFFTTDQSAGPGSIPGATEALPLPETSPSPAEG
jgi:Tfp pilus assembly protein PilO